MPHRLARHLPLVLIALAAVLGLVFLRDELSFAALARNQAVLTAYCEAHMGLTVAGFIAAYVAIVALSLPGATVATLTGGLLFGLFPGVLFNVVGATAGATLLFLAARMGLGAQFARRIDASPGALARLKRGIDENQWSVLFVMRLVPAVPFFVANLIPAFLDVPLHRFVVTTALGIVPGAIVYTSVGAGLGEVIARGESPDLSVLGQPHVLWPLLGLAALAAAPMAMRLLRREARA